MLLAAAAVAAEVEMDEGEAVMEGEEEAVEGAVEEGVTVDTRRVVGPAPTSKEEEAVLTSSLAAASAVAVAGAAAAALPESKPGVRLPTFLRIFSNHTPAKPEVRQAMSTHKKPSVGD